jgi:predicted double-glycine peptidase
MPVCTGMTTETFVKLDKVVNLFNCRFNNYGQCVIELCNFLYNSAEMTGKAQSILAVLLSSFMMTACNRTEQKTTKPTSDTISACGPKALSVVITYYRLNVSWDSLAKACHTTAKGTSLLELSNAAKMLGFDAVGLKTNFDELDKIPKPSIVFVNENHYATLLWSGPDSVLVDDSGVKNFIKKEEFQKQWGGVVLALYPTKELYKRVYQQPASGK